MVLDYAELMALVWILWGVSLVLTALRGFLEYRVQQRLHADAFFAFLGVISLTGLSAVITCLLPQFYLAADYFKAAMEDPLTPLPLPPGEFANRMTTSLKFMFSQMLLFWTTLWAAKFSILFFFRRIVLGLPNYMRAWWACFAVVFMLYLACMASNFLTCYPLSKYWSATGCSDPANVRRADASIKFATSADVVADILIMLLPLNLLRKLRIPLQHKFGLAIIFSLGTIIIAFAFIRLVQVTRATSDPDPTTMAEGPVLLSMWSHIESSVLIIVAALPAFRYLINDTSQHARDTGPLAPPAIGSEQPPGTKRGTKYTLSGESWIRGSLIRLHSSKQVGRGRNVTDSQTELTSIRGLEKHVDYSVEVTQ